MIRDELPGLLPPYPLYMVALLVSGGPPGPDRGPVPLLVNESLVCLLLASSQRHLAPFSYLSPAPFLLSSRPIPAVSVNPSFTHLLTPPLH